MNMDQAEALKEEKRQRIVKCVVWDLDNTLWDGTLLEGGINGLRPGVLTLMKTLDQRGILQSIASKNDHQLAFEQLKLLGISEYFLYPQINWGAKSASIERIAKDLNISLDTFAFIDDQAFEREEVNFALPEILSIDAAVLDTLSVLPAFTPRFITEDSAHRRQMYMADIERKTVEEHFDGPADSFLTSLEMKLGISHAGEADLKRAEELTLRTNQLNTTGYTYSYDELNVFRQSATHHLLVASLKDKYGDYGKIGLVLIALEENVWVIKLLLMSCRVMARGVGTVLINHLRNEARKCGVRLLAEMITNDRNRMMYMTYKFNHFRELEQKDQLIIFENDLSVEHEFPDYLIPDIGEPDTGEPDISEVGMEGVSLFDMTNFQPSIKGYSGVVSDGQYFYFIPLNNGDFFGTVARYDASQPFEDTASWHTFDTTQIDAGSRGFVDGLFDGRYLYLIPFCNGKHHGQITRYDTQKAFDNEDSWRVFDSTAIHPNSRGFVSGCFDGRYIYLSPYQLDHNTHHGQVTRFDTQAEFNNPTAWQVFDTAKVHIDSRGFHSAVSDDNYVYFIPYLRDGGEHSGILLCYDHNMPFEHPGAWQSFDMTTLGEQCQGYIGAVYQDGMIYFAPYRNNQQRHGNVLRFNTKLSVHDLAAWTVFDCEQVESGSRGFFGAICDEQYLYLLPHCRGLEKYHGQLARYKLSEAFDNPESWSICELEQADPACRGFIGGVIHQRQLYLAPYEIDAGCHSGLVARLDLEQPQVWQQPALELAD